MSDTIEGTASILAAFLVLFTAMIDPVVAAGLAVFILAMLGTYEIVRGRRHRDKQ